MKQLEIKKKREKKKREREKERERERGKFIDLQKTGESGFVSWL